MADLGFTLAHEHLKTWREITMLGFPQIYNEDLELEKVVNEVKAAESRGVKTICDATVPGVGRDIEFVQKVATKTNVNIIVATGFYALEYIHLPPYFQSKSVDVLADTFVREIRDGIGKTKVRAGFLKCVLDSNELTNDVEKVIRAVAKAHLQTGAPIMTHSNPGLMTGLKQQEIFRDEGVNLTRVFIGHHRDTDDIKYLKDFLGGGSFVGMDRFGGEVNVMSTEKRTAIVLKIWELGYADKIMLSQDYPCSSERWTPVKMRKFSVTNRTLFVSW